MTLNSEKNILEVFRPNLVFLSTTELERFASDKRSSLFSLFICDEEKKFYYIDTSS
jgi:hypothetical protein